MKQIYKIILVVLFFVAFLIAGMQVGNAINSTQGGPYYGTGCVDDQCIEVQNCVTCHYNIDESMCINSGGCGQDEED
jgi:hypothetical protein